MERPETRGDPARYSALSRGRAFIRAHDRHIASGAFVAGFILDNLTLPRVNMLLAQSVMWAYVILAAGSSALLLRFAGLDVAGWRARVLQSLPIVVQFSFGGILSALFVYYSRSASFLASWPFLALALLAIILNESIGDRARAAEVRVVLLALAILMTSAFVVPLLLGEIGPWVFALSFVLASLASAGLLWGFSRMSVHRTRFSFRAAGVSVALSYLAVVVLYVLRVIPPIPLALKEASVAYDVVRQGGQYALLVEPRSIWERMLPIREDVHIAPGESLTLFSSVVAPARFRTMIVHEWEEYDQWSGEWITRSTIAFPVSGGREEGYRGYSTKSAIRAGLWRVRITTEHGEVLGTKSVIVREDGGGRSRERVVR